MRHLNKINQLGRKTAHRHALLSNLAAQLIEHKRITTTVAKAKALRTYVEPIITRSKDDTTHSRRMVFSELQNKLAVTELFREVAPKVAQRPGGYTRIIRTGFRPGDSAEMCIIELVDFNELYVKEGKAATKKTRRSRKPAGEAKAAPTAKTVEAVETESKAVEKPAEETSDGSESPEKPEKSAEASEETPKDEGEK